MHISNHIIPNGVDKNYTNKAEQTPFFREIVAYVKLAGTEKFNERHFHNLIREYGAYNKGLVVSRLFPLLKPEYKTYRAIAPFLKYTFQGVHKWVKSYRKWEGGENA